MTDNLEHLAPMDRPGTLADRAREQLRSTIMAGRFEPGQKLTIRSVAKALNVSLTPAREALYGLASEGALDSGPNGTVSIPVFDEERVRELLVIRRALEGAAAREAIVNISNDAIREISAINDQLVEANNSRNYKKLMWLNWRFHFQIYREARMPTLLRMIENSWLKTGAYLNVLYPVYGESDQGLHNHEDIISALEARDGEALAKAVRADIEMAAQALLAVISAGVGVTTKTAKD